MLQTVRFCLQILEGNSPHRRCQEEILFQDTNRLLLAGGNLETVIAQDDHLPESCIQRFGADIIKGLHHIHSLGIVFSDIRPSKVRKPREKISRNLFVIVSAKRKNFSLS